MAIETINARQKQLTGNWSDFNKSKLIRGEIFIPNDHNPVVKTADDKIQEFALLQDMNTYEEKVEEVNEAISNLGNEYESTKNQLIAATKANADNAAESATVAATSANNASTYKDNAKTYMDNANEYAKEAKAAASSITGALKPKGTIAFKDLPNLSTADTGAMYNISDEFVSTDNFKDGGEITYPAGTNIYKTEDGMWDCLAGQLGDYLMKDDIDTAVEESMPDYTASTQLTELVAGEKMSTALGKIKTAVKNVISLVKLLGTTDISKIADGSVTGALNAHDNSINSLNSSLVNLSDKVKNISKYAYSTTGWADVFKQMGAVGDIGIGMTNLHNAINTTYSSSGVYDVYANGPALGVVLMRTSAEFYSGLIVFYREQAIAYSFARADGYFYARRISSYATK